MTATLEDERVATAPAPAGGGRAAARLRGRWRVALRYARRDARRDKGRTVLVAVLVALPVALGTFTTTVLWSDHETPQDRVRTELGPRLQASLTYAGLGLQQAPDGRGWGSSGDSQDSADLAEVERAVAGVLPGADTVARGLTALVQVHGAELLTGAGAFQADLAVPDVAAAFPLRSGRLPGPGEVALSVSTAHELGVEVGDQVSLSADPSSDPASGGGDLGGAVVSGLLARDQPQGVGVLLPVDGPLVAPEQLGVSQSGAWPRWFVVGDTPVTWHDVLALNEVGVVATSRQVVLSPPDPADVPYLAGQDQDLGETLQAWGLVGAVVLVGLLEAVLLIGPAFAVGARRSSRSLAVVAANGGTARTLRAVVLGSGVVIGLVGAVAGAALGIAGTWVLVATADLDRVRVLWPAVLGMVVVGVLIATVAAWLPARGASRADVVAVLAGRRGDVRHRRGPALVGAALGVLGYGAAVAAGVAAQPLLVAAGVAVGQVGLVLACGGIVALLGRSAGRLPLAGRLALRDAARHRSRTAPAVAAVLVAVAGATGGLVYSGAMSRHDARWQAVVAAPGVLVLSAYGEGPAGLLTDADVTTLRDIVRRVAPQAGDLQPVRVLRPAPEEGVSTVVLMSRPDGLDVGWGVSSDALFGPVVDDGSLVDLLGIPQPDVARRALADGRVVGLAGSVWPDGTVHLDVVRRDATTGDELSTTPVHVPGVGVGDRLGPFHASFPVIPPSLVAQVGGTVGVGGLVADASGLTGAQQDTLRATIDDELGLGAEGYGRIGVALGGTQDYGSPDWVATLLIVGSAALLALAAAWIAAALAAAESRPDLATLTAVGASPGTRKRVVAAAAGTIATIGAVLGVLSGIPLGAAFVLYERHRFAVPDPQWTVEVPWLLLGAMVVGLPLLAIVAAWLATRSRLVLTRRRAS